MFVGGSRSVYALRAQLLPAGREAAGYGATEAALGAGLVARLAYLNIGGGANRGILDKAAKQ